MRGFIKVILGQRGGGGASRLASLPLRLALAAA